MRTRSRSGVTGGTGVGARRAFGAVAGATATAAAIGAFAGGGFDDAARAAFAAVAGVALFAAVAADLVPARTWRSPGFAALAGLAILTVASAAWTIGDPGDAVAWGLTIAGYAALVAAASALAARSGGTVAVAAIVAGIAAVEAALGLAGFAVRAEPLALHVGGEWQAAGTFEYGTALALTELAAVPALLAAMFSGRSTVRAAAAACAAAAALAVGVSGSRFALAALAAVVAVAVAMPAESLRASRRAALAAAGVAVAFPLVALLALDPADPASALGSDAARGAFLAAVVAAAGVAWGLAGGGPGERWRGRGARATAARGAAAPVALTALACAVFAIGFAASAETERSGHGVEPSSGDLHGREELWSAAFETALERPVAGWGAETFLLASADEQGADPVLYAHSLPLEAAAELGLVGLLFVVALYAGTAGAIWRARATAAAWLFGPGVAVILASNLVDWTWHLAGVGAVFALCLGGLLGRASLG